MVFLHHFPSLFSLFIFRLHFPSSFSLIVFPYHFPSFSLFIFPLRFPSLFSLFIFPHHFPHHFPSSFSLFIFPHYFPLSFSLFIFPLCFSSPFSQWHQLISDKDTTLGKVLLICSDSPRNWCPHHEVHPSLQPQIHIFLLLSAMPAVSTLPHVCHLCLYLFSSL